MRIAFITPEFVTDYPDGGGLGNYLYRMGKLLVERGHNVEVFVSSYLAPRILMQDGIRVERVPSPQRNVAIKILGRICLVPGAENPISLFLQARALAAAMERRHRESAFDIVQSADYFAVGLAVRRWSGRIHVVRCSTAADLYNELDGKTSRGPRWRESLERRAMRKADKVFAPSRFVAEHYRNKHGIPVEVLRPPFSIEVAPAAEPPCGVPERFLVHFGQLRCRKGTHWLIEALKRSFEMESSLRMVWVGKHTDELRRVLAGLGTHRSKIQALQPLPKRELYALLQRADAAVLPSLVDNLPNTVIESLTLGIPVIGTRGASIDELVEPGMTGELVPAGDVKGLASAIVRIWRGQSEVRKGFTWRGGLAEEMRPETAVDNFLKLTTC